MTTARDVIKEALEDNDEVPLGQDPTAVQSSHGMKRLNQLLHGLKGEGADVGYADIELSDDVPLAPEYIRPLVKVMAFELVSPSRTAPATLFREAEAAKRTLQAAFVEVPLLKMDRGLRNRMHDSTGSDFETS